MPSIDPVKLCCGRRQSEHLGALCPDGKFMCCICFDRFDAADATIDPADGARINVCRSCNAAESRPSMPG